MMKQFLWLSSLSATTTTLSARHALLISLLLNRKPLSYFILFFSLKPVDNVITSSVQGTTQKDNINEVTFNIRVVCSNIIYARINIVFYFENLVFHLISRPH